MGFIPPVLEADMSPSKLVFCISSIANGEKQVLGASARISHCTNVVGSDAGSELQTSQVG